MSNKKEVTITNKEFFKNNFPSICAEHDIESSWVTLRQSNKYRNQKGRVYLTIKHGRDHTFGR